MSSYTDYIWATLYNFIGNEYGTAGLMGNLQAESGCIPFRLQGDFSGNYNASIRYTQNVDDGSYTETQFVNDSRGYGLAQWTWYSRKQGLYDMWRNGGYSSIGDTGLGCAYLIYELQNSYPSVLAVLRSATSVREASNVVLHDFENPEHQEPEVEDVREQLSIAFYNQYATGAPIPVPVPPDPVNPDAPTIPVWLYKKIADNNRLY